MRICMLTWEYPPRIVGGIARHVEGISRALAGLGEHVTVITAAHPDAPAFEESDGVRIHRVEEPHVRSYDFESWIHMLNFGLSGKAVELARAEPFDFIHCHDWVTGFAGVTLKRGLSLPLVVTIHATEHGRNMGIHSEEQRYIDNIEWWLCYEAQRILVCSRYMEKHIGQIFRLPGDKIRCVANGIDPHRFRASPSDPAFRRKYAADDEKIVLFVGRLVREKGVHLLVTAAPRILHYHPRTKFVIVGGGDVEGIRRHAEATGFGQQFYVAGYVPDEELKLVYRIADVAVYPSLYEPFGIVALEAMAAGVPVVVSDVGGFSEIVTHDVNGLKHYPDNPDSIGWAVRSVLLDPERATQRAQQAYKDVVERHSWPVLAAEIRRVYKEIAGGPGRKTAGRAASSARSKRPEPVVG